MTQLTTIQRTYASLMGQQRFFFGRWRRPTNSQPIEAKIETNSGNYISLALPSSSPPILHFHSSTSLYLLLYAQSGFFLCGIPYPATLTPFSPILCVSYSAFHFLSLLYSIISHPTVLSITMTAFPFSLSLFFFSFSLISFFFPFFHNANHSFKNDLYLCFSIPH